MNILDTYDFSSDEFKELCKYHFEQQGKQWDILSSSRSLSVYSKQDPNTTTSFDFIKLAYEWSYNYTQGGNTDKK